MQARPQEPPEVYSNLLPPSVGETTGGYTTGNKIIYEPELSTPFTDNLLLNTIYDAIFHCVFFPYMLQIWEIRLQRYSKKKHIRKQTSNYFQKR